MPGVKIFYSSVAGKRRKKLLPGQGFLQYANFHTLCSQNNAYVESSYFAQKCINFHLQPSRFEKFSTREKPSDPWSERERREWEGIKEFHALKQVEGRKREERNEKEELRKGRASRSEGARAILLQAVAAPEVVLTGAQVVHHGHDGLGPSTGGLSPAHSRRLYWRGRGMG